MATPPPAVALVGTFDVDNYGDHLFPRIARRELTRRVPDLRVDAYSPFGWRHPTRLDGDAADRVHPLGAPTDARRQVMADAYDAVIVGGGELLHLRDRLMTAFYDVDEAVMDEVAPSRWFLEGLGAEGERTCPVLWHGIGVPFDFDTEQAARVRAALVHRRWASVRDAASAARLRAAGVGEDTVLDVVPDSGLLVDRLFRPEELEASRRRLRAQGSLPTNRPALVLQGCDLLVPHVREIAAAVEPLLREEELAPVLLETGRCRQDGAFADALGAALGGEVRRVPADASVADIVAVLAGAEAVVASSLHAAVTALAFRRPFVTLNLGAEAKLDGFGDRVGLADHVIHHVDDLAAALAHARAAGVDDTAVAALQDEVDRHFDRLVELVPTPCSTGRAKFLHLPARFSRRPPFRQ